MDKLTIGARTELALALANRHGLVAGATGTGKTVTLQTLAEQFSRAGVPVFAADVKGDLSGIAAGADNPVMFWDVFGAQGRQIQCTVSRIGPVLLARMLSLNAVQEGVLNIAFRTAQSHAISIGNLEDLRWFLTFLLSPQGEQWASPFGRVSAATVGTIQRQILVLEMQGGTEFFSRSTAFTLAQFLGTDRHGHGRINILAADQLLRSPRLYATVVLWLLTKLFDELPEVGDQSKPRLVFFFDEAHLLFTDAPRALLEQIERVVRLIRSKGVGVYFVTQSPLDIPDRILGQLGHRIQHALRAFTPREQKAVKAAAQTFRPDPTLDTARAITELGIGEALVSVLQTDGSPAPVQRIAINRPASRIGALTPHERNALQTHVGAPVVRLFDKAA